MKHWVAAVLAVVCLLGARPVRAQGPGDVSAACAVLMEAQTGRVLYEKQGHTRSLIASTTKLLTALTARRSGLALTEEVEILPEYTGIEGSSIYLRAGERLRLETLLYGMLLCSGNDAAQAVAGFCGRDGDFVQAMNRTARELGMQDSHFANPSGLDEEEHYSTAYDLALLARACLDDEVLRDIVAARSVSMQGRSFVNHNKLLWRYPGCIGLKTGYTRQAGRTLVSAARREGVTLIAVTLNAPDDWRDHGALLDWGFEHCRVEQVVQTGQKVGLLPAEGSLLPAVPVAAQESLYAALLPEERAQCVVQLDTDRASAATAGEAVGRLICMVNGEVQGETALCVPPILDCRVPKRSLGEKIKEWWAKTPGER